MIEKTLPKICPLFYILHGKSPYCGCDASLNRGNAEKWHQRKYLLKLCEKSIVKTRSRVPYYFWCTIFSNWYWEDVKDKNDKVMNFLRSMK